jgi:hypothetical protein
MPTKFVTNPRRPAGHRPNPRARGYVCVSDTYCPTPDTFSSLADFQRMCVAVFGERAKLSARVDGTYVDERGEEVLRPAANKSRVPMRRNYSSASTATNYLRDLRPAQVAQMVREGSLAITHADIGNDYHTVTLFEEGAGENRKRVEAKWFVPGEEWYNLSLGLRDGKVDPSTADLFLGPSGWDKREREEQTRAAAKRKGIDIDASRHYFNNPRRNNPRRNTDVPADAVFYATTRGGRYQIVITPAGEHNGEKFYDLEEFTSGSSSARGYNNLEGLRSRIPNTLHYAKAWDGINYEVKVDTLGLAKKSNPRRSTRYPKMARLRALRDLMAGKYSRRLVTDAGLTSRAPARKTGSGDEWMDDYNDMMAHDEWVEAVVAPALEEAEREYKRAGGKVQVARLPGTPEDLDYETLVGAKEIRRFAKDAPKRKAQQARAMEQWYADTVGPLGYEDNPRRNPDAATPRAFLSVLRSKLTQHDVKLSAKQPNMYRLGHYLAAAERVEKDMGKSLDSTSPAALEKLRQSLHKRFDMPFTPASAVERQIDAYLAKGTMPSLVRKNPPTGFRIAGPAVKTMSEGLRISKADAQRLKDMMDTGAPRILQAADKMMNGHGVERISGVGGGLMYVNMGDTYDTTLIYDYKTNRFVVSSWGDIVERQPRRFPD